MATTHGRKSYYQILIDPNRAALIENEARKAGQRPTAWIRDTLYGVLERRLPSSIYEEAVQKDNANWRKSVDNRLEGRARARAGEQVLKQIGKDSAESAA